MLAMSDRLTQALVDAIAVAIREAGGRRALAARLGVSAESLRRWASGERGPSFTVAAAIFDLAGRPLLSEENSLESRLARIEEMIGSTLTEGRTSSLEQSAYRENIEVAYRDLLAGLAILERTATERLSNTRVIDYPGSKE